MKHEVSKSDMEFRAAFEAGAYAPADFNHRAHVRLAYIYLATNDVERATTLMRNAITNYLRHHGISPTKYHETLTQAWILAVFHYLPLHLSEMGRALGGRVGQCPVSEDASDRLVRLPFFTGLSESEQDRVIDAVLAFPG